MRFSRRELVAFSAGSVAITGALAYEGWRLFGKHYPPTPYDDLLDLLPDRDAAKAVGRVFLAMHSNFTPAKAARALRTRIRGRALLAVANEEISHGELGVAGGWIVPATLLGLCALAAKV